MAFDFKKEYREFYLPPVTPSIVDIPPMDYVAAQEGLSIDIGGSRLHHEIYLSDPRKTSTDKLKTVIRYPVK